MKELYSILETVYLSVKIAFVAVLVAVTLLSALLASELKNLAKDKYNYEMKLLKKYDTTGVGR